MDTLRNLFGNTVATILRLALIAGTLALVYVFAIKPVLDTTEDISNRAFEHSNQTQNRIQRQIQQSINQTQQQINKSIQGSIPTTQVPKTVQIERTISGLNPKQAKRLNRCIQRAEGSIGAINACFDRFEGK